MRKVLYLLPLLFSLTLVNAQPGNLHGTFTPSITPVGTGSDELWGVAVQPDGKVVAVGRTNYNTDATTDTNFLVVRYNTDGSLDASFGGGDGIVVTDIGPSNDYAFAVHILSNGNILVAGVGHVSGNDNDFTVVRYEPDGDVDLTFGTSGIAQINLGPGAGTNDHCQAMAIDSDGKIVLGGYRDEGSNADFAIARLLSDGTPDGSFGGGDGVVITDVISGLESNGAGQGDYCAALLIQSDDKYILSGSTGSSFPQYDFALVRYNDDGTLDGTFGGGDGIVITSIDEDDHAYGAFLQGDGKIVQAGWVGHPADSDPGTNTQTFNVAAIRYNTDGSLDNTFSGDGIFEQDVIVSGDDKFYSVKMQNDNKLVFGGTTGSDYLLVRLNSDGTTDNTFSGDGIVTYDVESGGQLDVIHGIRLANSNIYAVGYSASNHNISVAAFQNDATPLPVTLSQFYAQKQTGSVKLQWQSSMEENVKQFIIERSSDGKAYKAIGAVAAAGNSNTIKNYSFTDQSPFTAANNYYRLIMQDLDGNIKYSKVLIVKFGTELTSNMQLFPSPVKDVLQIQLPEGLRGNIGLFIIDANGRIVKKNNIASDGHALSTSFEVGNLPTGVYILKAQAGNTSVISRFIKQ